jgi:uncharacterized protein YgiM (DUF1202 family)
LPDWGSTTSKLKSTYGTPEKFMKTWDSNSSSATSNTSSTTKASSTTTDSKSKTEAAKSKDSKYSKTYTTTKAAYVRAGAGSKKDIIIPIAKGEKVTCYGYYTKVGTAIWLYVTYGKYTGFVTLAKLK